MESAARGGEYCCRYSDASTNAIRRRLLEASSLIDDVFASTLASRIEPEAAIILADAALACPAAATGAPPADRANAGK